MAITREMIRQANQNLIDNKLTPIDERLPYEVQQKMRKRRYSAQEMNEGYARAIVRIKG